MSRISPKLLCSVCSIPLLLTAPHEVSAQFQQSDLAGTFEAFSRWDVESNNDPGWTHTSDLEIATDGDFLGGSLIDSEGTTASVTGGSFVLESSGRVGGTLVRSGFAEEFEGFQMDPSGNLIVGVDSEDVDDAVEIDVAVRVDGSFSSADLVDTWYLYVLEDSAEPDPNEPGWAWGEITIDGSGQVSVVASAESDGGGLVLTGLVLTIAPDGNVQSNAFGSRFQMSPDKEVIVGVLSDGTSRQLALLVRGGNGFATSDLAGTWRSYSLVDVSVSNSPFWTRGFVSLAASGDVLSGAKAFPTGGVSPAAGGALSIDGSGVVAGSIDYPVIDSDTFAHAKMSPSGNLIVGVGPNLAGGSVFRSLTVFVLPEPVGGLSTGLAALALAGLHRRRRS